MILFIEPIALIKLIFYNFISIFRYRIFQIICFQFPENYKYIFTIFILMKNFFRFEFRK